MPTFTWDNSLSLDGLATALGVLGAAIGYVINLIRSWRAERRDSAARGAKFVLLELLESDLLHGRSEDDLFEAYSNPATQPLIQKYSATKPGKLERVEMERLLRVLQYESMIDVVGTDAYRLNARLIGSHERDEAHENSLRRLITDQVDGNEVLRGLEVALAQATNDWEAKRALELMLKLNPEGTVPRLKFFLGEQGSTARSLAAAELVSRYHSGLSN